MTFKHLSAIVAVSATALLAACADGSGPIGGGAGVTTSAVPETPKVDPACMQLASQIDGLKKEGVAEKMAQAAAKKYKLTPADIAKADQLNRANTDFQARCSTVPRSATTTASAPATSGGVSVVPPVPPKATPGIAAAAAAAKAKAE